LFSIDDFSNGLFDGLLLSITAGGVAWMIQLCFKLFNNLTKG
jgi:hypothetical protein